MTAFVVMLTILFIWSGLHVLPRFTLPQSDVSVAQICRLIDDSTCRVSTVFFTLVGRVFHGVLLKAVVDRAVQLETGHLFAEKVGEVIVLRKRLR